MTEAAQAAAGTQQQPLSVAQAAEVFAKSKAGLGSNDISAHASAMAKRSHEARRERTTQESGEVKSQPEAGGEDVVNDQTNGKPGAGTQDEIDAENNASSTDQTQTEDESDAEEAQTIDLGDGVKVTLDEVREGFMLKADHTRKTQKLSEERREVEAIRTQELTRLEKLIATLEPMAEDGKPKTRKDFFDEYGVEDGLDKWEAHQKRVAAAKELTRRTREESQAKAKARAIEARDQHLAETYNKEWADPKKQDEAYTKISTFALSKGVPAEVLGDLTEPWAIEVLDMARQFAEIQAAKGKVKTALAPKPPVVRPGAKVSAQAQAHTGANVAKANLEKSGSWQDGVALLRAMRGTRPS